MRKIKMLLSLSMFFAGEIIAKPLESTVFNIQNVKEIESPLSKGILFKPLLHPTRQDGSAIDLEKGRPDIHHSIAQFTIKPGFSWPVTVFTIAEIYIITEGKGEILIDGKTRGVKKGDVIYVAPNLERAISNTDESNLVYISITDPEWSPEAETQKK